MRRIKSLVVTFEQLTHLLSQQDGLPQMPCLPEDAKVVHLETRFHLNTLTVFIESETFPPVAPNMEPERLPLSLNDRVGQTPGLAAQVTTE